MSALYIFQQNNANIYTYINFIHMSNTLVLKTITATSIAEMTEDLNANFSQLLNLIGIKGIKGDDGQTGDIGSTGKRGAQFTFLNLDAFAENFAVPTNADDITIDTVNAAVAENAVLFFTTCVNSADIVHLDYLILPNGDVIQYNATSNMYETTYLKLYKSINQLTEEQIIQLILQYSSTANSVHSVYTSVNKIVADDNPNAEVLNSTLSANSVADIPVTDASSGFSSAALVFIALQESIGVYGDSNKAQIVSVLGHASDYHNLLQNTLAANKLSSAPKISNSPVLAAIQNTNTSGIVFGSKDANTLDNFGHIRKNGDAIEIMPYYVNDASYVTANAILSLSNSMMTMRSNIVNVNAKNSYSLFIDSVEALKATADNIDIKHTLKISKLAKTTNTIVSLDTTGLAYTTPLKTQGNITSNGNAIVIESLIYGFTESYVNNRLGISTNTTVAQYVNNLFSQLQNQITTLQNQVNALSLNLTTTNQKLAIFVKDGVIFPWRKPANQIPPGFAEVTDFAGKTLVGLDPNDADFNAIGKMFGSKTHTLTVAEMPRHDFYIASNSGPINTTSGQLKAYPNNALAHERFKTETDADYQLFATNNGLVANIGKTNSVGNDTPHNNVQPSKVVMFIEWTGS